MHINIIKRILYTVGLIKYTPFVDHIIAYEHNKNYEPRLLTPTFTINSKIPHMPYNPFNASDYNWYKYDD